MEYKPLYNLSQIKEKAANFSVKSILKDFAYQNKPLDFDRAYMLGVYTLAPYRKELEGIFTESKEDMARSSLVALCSLHNRATYENRGKVSGEYPAADQIAGICAAVFDYDIGLSSKGYLNPDVNFAIDNCGMGGDIRVTPNVSTVSAFIAASTGIPMCKHGSPSNADGGRHGSSDFVAKMALEMEDYKGLLGLSKERIEESIERFGFGYTEALDPGYKFIHEQTHEYAKLPHMNDIIGPITNPLVKDIARKKIIGINQLIKPVVIAQAYKILNEKGITNVDDGIFLRGFIYPDRIGPNNDDGMDELSIMAGGTNIARLKNEKIEEYDLFARDFGIAEANYEEIMPPLENGKYQKGPFSYKILKNEESGRAKDMVLANAALIEHLANGTDLKSAYHKMKDVLDRGEPFKNLLDIRKFLRSR